MNKPESSLQIFIKDHLLIISFALIWIFLLVFPIKFQEIVGFIIVFIFNLIIWNSIRINYNRYLKYGNRKNLDLLPKSKVSVFEFLTEGLAKSNISTYQGRIQYQFIIDSNGKLIDPKVIESPKSIDESLILKIIKTNNVWIPGEKGNIPVPYFYFGGFEFGIDKNGSINFYAINDTKKNMESEKS